MIATKAAARNREVRTLPPGLLVSMGSSLSGNTKYLTQELEATHVDENGEEIARWETTRVTADPAEHDEAVKIRGRARYLIERVCIPVGKGSKSLLCPERKADELFTAISEAREMVDEFNRKAKVTYLSFEIYTGRIAQDDTEAVKAISAELRRLMEDMQQGLKDLDVEAVREAANKANRVGEMLSDDAQARVAVAVRAARESARKMAKAGKDVVLKIDRTAIAQIGMARTSFLDLDVEQGEIATPTMDARILDLEA